jgi:hypothetical protein
VDLSVSKALRFRDRVRAELRWEVFNVFNAVNFALPENNFDSLDSRRSRPRWAGPRVSQFGVRLLF